DRPACRRASTRCLPDLRRAPGRRSGLPRVRRARPRHRGVPEDPLGLARGHQRRL
ncbi:MAG: hypothetical protein AVDCRST_MAG34-1729, partial [uncultured Nocardioidaceae bacterium]